MDIKKLQAIVVDALEDIKGQDIALFDTTHLTSLFDRICVVSGTSNRQTKGHEPGQCVLHFESDLVR